MIKWSHVLVVAGALILSGIAHSESVAMSADMKALPFSQMGAYTSAPGETEQAFLLRVAGAMQTYTMRTGQEICGAIARQHDTFSVVLGTNHSQIGCLAGEAGVIEGAIPTGETIHSHPAGSLFRLNRMDRQFAWATHAADPGARTFRGSPNGFSETDYESGPGYLVAGGRLFYQSRPKQTDVIGAL